MLETELHALTQAVASLTATVETLNVNIENLFKASNVTVDLISAECAKANAAAKADKTPAKVDETPAKADETVSTEELQRFVLQLVREKRHLRDKIKALVQEITGVNFMHDVPQDKAAELKSAIEALAKEEQ